MAPVVRIAAPPIKVREALGAAIRELEKSHVPSATLAAELLLMHVLDRDRGYVYTHPEQELSAASSQTYFELVAERATGKPTQYLTGHQEFWGLDFEVTPDVLIPRPETEHLVEAALDFARRTRGGQASPGTGSAAAGAGLRIVDVGTGSGCIALALATELPGAEIFATDISRPALSVAHRNARRLGLLSRVRFIETDLLAGLKAEGGGAEFDFVISNPPYVGEAEIEAVQREVREFEPRVAWGGAGSGLEIYRRLLPQALTALRPGGWLAVEVGFTQADAVRAMLGGGWSETEIRPDLAGIPRVVIARKERPSAAGRSGK